MGSLCGGFVLHLIQIFITLGIFITGDLEIYPDDKEDNNQTAGQGQTNKKSKFKKKLE